MSLDSFFVSRCTEEEIERRNRIRLSVAAYAYEIHDDPIMADAEFDDLANKINVQKTTSNEIMDDFFREEFSPHTGQWIHKHPNMLGLERVYTKYFSRN
jgi:hypothetical protein